MIDTGSSNPSSSSNNKTGVIIGAVVAAVVVLVTIIFIVACFLYRRMLSLSKNDKERNIGEIQNAAFEGESQQNGRLSLEASSESAYEEPAEYAQLDNFRRVSINQNYQSLRRRDEQDGSWNTREDAILGTENEIDDSDGGGEELAEYTQLDNSTRVPIGENYQSLNWYGEFGDAEDSVEA